MNTNYIETPSQTTKIKNRKFSAIFSMIFATLVVVLGGGTLITASMADKAEAFDVTQWVMCEVLPAPAPDLYQFTQSDDLQFMLRSKSSVTSGVSDVETGLNWILNLFGPGFRVINSDITGVPMDIVIPSGEDEEEPEESEDEEKDYNHGVKVTPYDRFGVAGLNFTAYSGEWKYIVINACSTDSEPSDPKAGVYYDERLEPRSTWDDMDNSKDVRTVQFTKGFTGHMDTAVNNVIANGIFTVTKTIVVLTTGLIGFAFSDVTEAIGLNDLVSEDGGMFDMVFSGVFTPLIVMVFVITAANIFYLGVIKRQFRNSLGILFRSLLMFLMAVIIAAAPAFWISLPNKVAVIGQSILITALNPNMTSGDGLCATDIGSRNFQMIEGTSQIDDSLEDEIGLLESTAENMRSAIGCTFWESFLVTPWSEAQFGTDWNQLWAAGATADWAPEGSGELQNGNEEQVGLAEVPVGDGAVINNWALYQISVQTNVHVPTGHEGERSKYTSGVANDWWRIVDAVANYQEEEVTEVVSGSGPHGTPQEITYTLPKADAFPTESWDDWTGNNSWNRIGIASSSVIIALIGSFLPLVLGLMSAVYAFGIVLLMIFAPVMLLLGCWGGRGWEMFKGWGELVVNTTMKRILTGLLLGLAITFTVQIIEMMQTIPWWQGILLLLLVAALIFNIRHKIFDMLAAFRFSSTGFGGTADRLTQTFTRKATNMAKSSGKLALGTAAGGVGAAAAGGKMGEGMAAGFKNEFKNMVYRSDSKFLNSARMTQEAFGATDSEKDDSFFRGSKYCGICGAKIEIQAAANGTEVFHGGQQADGTIICYECYHDGVDPDASEFIVRRKPTKKKDRKQVKIEKKFTETFTSNTHANDRSNKKIVRELEADRTSPSDGSEGAPLSVDDRSRKINALGKFVSMDIVEYENSDGERTTPEIPDYLKPYLNDRELRMAWEDKEYRYIQAMYAAAILRWYNENHDYEINTNFNQLLKSMDNVTKKYKVATITKTTTETTIVDGDDKIVTTEENIEEDDR